MRKIILCCLLFPLIAGSVWAQPPIVWDRYAGGDYDDCGYSVQLVGDDDYITCGVNDQSAGADDFYLLSCNDDGTSNWAQTWSYTYDQIAYSVVTFEEATHRRYVFTGCSDADGTPDWDVVLFKTNDQGTRLWSETYGTEDFEEVGRHVERTTDGGFIITGWTETENGGDDRDVLLIKTDSDGDVSWSNTYGGSDDDRGYCVKQTPDSGYIVCGYKTNNTGGTDHRDAYLIKTNSSGTVQWEYTYYYTGYEAVRQEGHSVVWFLDESEDIHYTVCGLTYDEALAVPPSLRYYEDQWAFQVDDTGSMEWSERYQSC